MIRDKVLQAIHPMLIKVFSRRRTFDLIVEGTIPHSQQCIFVANHFCIHDIPTAGEIIQRHTYVLVSDEDRYTFNGLALSMNGVIWMKRLDKNSRIVARAHIVQHLKAGHNVLIYPEATWNLTANLPMLPMNWGVIGISKEVNIPIVPIYLLFLNNKCCAKIGEPYYPTGCDVTALNELRDRMATLFFDLLEQQPIGSRKDIPSDYLAASIKNRYNEYGRARKDPDGVKKYESQFIFKPKGLVTCDEAFAHMQNFIPCKENAFLFRNRNGT